MSKEVLTQYIINDHGIHHEQYFQGAGIAFTPYKNIATGCGDNWSEAFEDALEQIAITHDLGPLADEELIAVIKKDHDHGWNTEKWAESVGGSNESVHYYVSILYNLHGEAF